MKLMLGGHSNYFIELELDGRGGGKLTSNLKDEESANDGEDDVYEYNIAIDGIEALVLAQACAGVNIQTPEYAAALLTAVVAVQNQIIQ